jgi:hypothetical protein
MWKTAVRDMVDAKINVIYMELYSGAKMANGKYRKSTLRGRLIERTLFPSDHSVTAALLFY